MPDQPFLLIISVILLSLFFDFINGFHDTANSVATSIATGALSPHTALILASSMNFTGALIFTGVAHTISGRVVNPVELQNGLMVIMAALISAISWNLLTWCYGLPSSSSHALIGSLAGAAFAATNGQGINYAGFINVLTALIISPLLAFLAGFCVMSFVYYLKCPKHNFLLLQRMAAAFQAFSHGSNDAQKTMGIITLTLVITGYQDSLQVPLWVKVISALAIASGTAAGGWRIIKTVSSGITRLEAPNGFAADLSSALTILSATLLHLPVSTTHVISSSIVGVGITKGINAVNWNTVLKIILAWVFTLPVSILTSALIFSYL